MLEENIQDDLLLRPPQRKAHDFSKAVLVHGAVPRNPVNILIKGSLRGLGESDQQQVPDLVAHLAEYGVVVGLVVFKNQQEGLHHDQPGVADALVLAGLQELVALVEPLRALPVPGLDELLLEGPEVAHALLVQRVDDLLALPPPGK